jgi:hypothetical protein
MTLGDKRVRRNFNPSANPDIENVKAQFSLEIDKLEQRRSEHSSGEYQRLISKAQTSIEDACSDVVKALTFSDIYA